MLHQFGAQINRPKKHGSPEHRSHSVYVHVCVCLRERESRSFGWKQMWKLYVWLQSTNLSSRYQEASLKEGLLLISPPHRIIQWAQARGPCTIRGTAKSYEWKNKYINKLVFMPLKWPIKQQKNHEYEIYYLSWNYTIAKIHWSIAHCCCCFSFPQKWKQFKH